MKCFDRLKPGVWQRKIENSMFQAAELFSLMITLSHTLFCYNLKMLNLALLPRHGIEEIHENLPKMLDGLLIRIFFSSPPENCNSASEGHGKNTDNLQKKK